MSMIIIHLEWVRYGGQVKHDAFRKSHYYTSHAITERYCNASGNKHASCTSCHFQPNGTYNKTMGKIFGENMGNAGFSSRLTV